MKTIAVFISLWRKKIHVKHISPVPAHNKCSVNASYYYETLHWCLLPKTSPKKLFWCQEKIFHMCAYVCACTLYLSSNEDHLDNTANTPQMHINSVAGYIIVTTNIVRSYLILEKRQLFLQKKSTMAYRSTFWNKIPIWHYLSLFISKTEITDMYNTHIFKSMYVNQMKPLPLRQTYEDTKTIFQLNIHIFNISK